MGPRIDGLGARVERRGLPATRVLLRASAQPWNDQPMPNAERTPHATHTINDVMLTIVLDQAGDGTWTAAWWYPMPMVPAPPEWSDGSEAGYVSRVVAEEAAIAWAREHGPQR